MISGGVILRNLFSRIFLMNTPESEGNKYPNEINYYMRNYASRLEIVKELYYISKKGGLFGP